MRKKLSLVVPMYNESAAIDDFFERVNKVSESLSKEFETDLEIIAVNDGSKDDTLEKLTRWHKSQNNVGIVNLSRNFGQEPAVFAGLEKAGGDAVIVLDADMQDPPEVIGEMVAKWTEGYDVVNAVRTRKKDKAFKRNSAGLYYRVLNKLSYKVRYPANVNNFRLISRRALDTILAMPEKNKFYRGLVPFAGFKTASVVFARQERTKGESKYNLKAMMRLAADGIASTSTKPLIFSLYAGIILCVLSVLGVAPIIIFSLIKHFKPEYIVYSVIAITAFFTGVILIFMSISGFYIGKIFLEVKGRPFSIVQDFYAPEKDGNKDD